MHWILQDNLFNEAAYGVLLETLQRFNIPHSIHKVIPFIGELTPEPEKLHECRVNEFSSRGCEYGTKCCVVNHLNVICMGSYSLRHSAKKFGWNPGVFDLEPFNFEIQRQHWGNHMLNFDSVVCKFEDANFDDELMFIRPIEDSKVFAGRVFDKEDFYTWKRKVCVLEEDYGNSLSKSTLIQLSKPKKIYSEHRVWVVKGEIVCGSTYMLGGKIIYQALPSDSVFLKYAEERIAEWQPLDAFVIDVADTADGFKVVEINTLNSSGFYACDIQKLVMALEDAFSERN